MKKLLLIFLLLFVGNSIEVDAKESNEKNFGASEYIINLGGVDDKFTLMFNDTVNWGKVGNIYVYEDAYMGNMIMTSYGEEYYGIIISIFGAYYLEFDSSGTIVNISSTDMYGLPTEPVDNTAFTEEDLFIISQNVKNNKEWIENNKPVYEGTAFDPIAVYNNEFLQVNNVNEDFYKAFYLAEISSFKIAFLNAGIPNEVNYHEPIYSTFQGPDGVNVFDYSIAMTNKIDWIKPLNDIIDSMDADYFIFNIDDHIGISADVVYNQTKTGSYSWVSSDVIRRPESVVHEFGHTVGLDHINAMTDYMYDEIAHSDGQYFTIPQNNLLTSSIMGYADAPLLWYSNPNLYTPSTTYEKFGEYKRNSYEFLTKEDPDYINVIERVSNYAEDYNVKPMIEFPKIENGYEIYGFYGIYTAKSLSDSGYDDFIFPENVTTEIDDTCNTYNPGGTGLKYDVVCVKATDEVGNSIHYKRYVENLEGTYENPILDADDLVVPDRKYYDDFLGLYVREYDFTINPNNNYDVIFSEENMNMFLTRTTIELIDSQNNVYSYEDYQSFAPGEEVTLRVINDQRLEEKYLYQLDIIINNQVYEIHIST